MILRNRVTYVCSWPLNTAVSKACGSSWICRTFDLAMPRPVRTKKRKKIIKTAPGPHKVCKSFKYATLTCVVAQHERVLTEKII